MGGLEFDIGDTLIFRKNKGGQVEIAFFPLQSAALEKVAWHEGGDAKMGTVGLFLMIFVSPLIFWPLGALMTKIRKRALPTTEGARRARRTAAIMSELNFIFLVTLLLSV